MSQNTTQGSGTQANQVQANQAQANQAQQQAIINQIEQDILNELQGSSVSNRRRYATFYENVMIPNGTLTYNRRHFDIALDNLINSRKVARNGQAIYLL